jgi:L-arabinokinase
VSEVLRRVRELEPEVGLLVVSGAPEELFRGAFPGPFDFRGVRTDVGLVQRDALQMDFEATGTALEAFERRFPSLVDEEASVLRSSGASLVLGDIPPLAFAAAERAGVGSVGLGNFSWDWIYRYFAPRHPAFSSSAGAASEAYGSAGLLLELPFAGDLGAFPRRRAIPLVARRPRVGRDEVRSRLGLGGGVLALWSFGGAGLPGFDFRRLPPLPVRFVTVGGEGPGVTGIPPGALRENALSYADLVGACDVVVTKPGYGIVSDTIGARGRLLYTDRGDFPEYPILVRGMEPFLPTRYVASGDLLGGRFGPALEELLALPVPEPPDLSGAEVAARVILEAVKG